MNDENLEESKSFTVTKASELIGTTRQNLYHYIDLLRSKGFIDESSNKLLITQEGLDYLKDMNIGKGGKIDEILKKNEVQVINKDNYENSPQDRENVSKFLGEVAIQFNYLQDKLNQNDAIIAEKDRKIKEQDEAIKAKDKQISNQSNQIINLNNRILNYLDKSLERQKPKHLKQSFFERMFSKKLKEERED